MSYRNGWRAALWGAAGLLFAACGFAQSPSASATADPVQAIWKAQEITFTFESFTTFYSCSSLEAKLKRILTAVGADPTMKVRSRGCFERNSFQRMPVVEIALASPVAATPEALAERDKNRSVRELAARVRGASKLLEQAEAQFPAHWKTVSLSRGDLRLDPGDCELIDQLKKKVFPQLGVRLVEDRVKCAPNTTTPNQPRLVVEALTAMPRPDAPVAPNRT